jgi:hypothetical protein
MANLMKEHADVLTGRDGMQHMRCHIRRPMAGRANDDHDIPRGQIDKADVNFGTRMTGW